MTLYPRYPPALGAEPGAIDSKANKYTFRLNSQRLKLVVPLPHVTRCATSLTNLDLVAYDTAIYTFSHRMSPCLRPG